MVGCGGGVQDLYLKDSLREGKFIEPWKAHFVFLNRPADPSHNWELPLSFQDAARSWYEMRKEKKKQYWKGDNFFFAPTLRGAKVEAARMVIEWAGGTIFSEDSDAITHYVLK